jgi:hypothetical protein
MKTLAVAILLAALGFVAGVSATPVKSQSNTFTVDQFVAVALEYQGARALVGANTYGPTDKEFECIRGAQAGVSQSDDILPAGHKLVTTCIHVLFSGPLPNGVAVAVPPTGIPIEYLTIGVEYTGGGDFKGAQALHVAPDLKTCMSEARDLLKSNYGDGSVPAGNSPLLYCTPIPMLQQNQKNDGGVV